MKGYIWQTKKIDFPGMENSHAVIRELKQSEYDKATNAKITMPIEKGKKAKEVTFMDDAFTKNRLLIGYSLTPIDGQEDVGMFLNGEKFIPSKKDGFMEFYTSIPRKIGELLLKNIAELNDISPDNEKNSDGE